MCLVGNIKNDKRDGLPYLMEMRLEKLGSKPIFSARKIRQRVIIRKPERVGKSTGIPIGDDGSSLAFQ